jgi:hypothetical protein
VPEQKWLHGRGCRRNNILQEIENETGYETEQVWIKFGGERSRVKMILWILFKNNYTKQYEQRGERKRSAEDHVKM